MPADTFRLVAFNARFRGKMNILRSSASKRRACIGALTSVLLGGCATLPSNGPTAHQIRKGAQAADAGIRFEIVDLTPDLVEATRRQDEELSSKVPALGPLARNSRVDQIGPGDVLSISVYEVGVALFSGSLPAAAGEGFDPSAHAQTIPVATVDSDGMITIPFVGRMKVAGLTPAQVEEAINRALRGKSQNPQTVVTIRQNVANSIYVSGELRRPGRFEISPSREHLLDAIAASGGSVNSAEDTIVRFTRDGTTVEERLAFIRAGTADDLMLAPGDHIELLKRPRTYTVFGAVQKASQVNFETGEVSLAEALARAGGPNDAAADPSAIYLFRLDGLPDGSIAGPPKVYRLNMLKPSSYLLAQRFRMRDKDVLYIANAAANQPSKLINVINQLFSPFVTARALSR
ncbi:polysaccharide biosynthesis/export family protein [Sphingomonas morindae]|uniref:Polysaccharide export protein n=1 Tax=Sphingomonas morindae TaxID=1541170 RepID=A0ABY4X675_9SPHN|nr:polysaccharide biosynthesis/export family protein [Sphingomonas morindae]USI72362.1 polysaccharide export protein [Sphingomonas morindae]